jgi:hypothetical protein
MVLSKSVLEANILTTESSQPNPRNGPNNLRPSLLLRNLKENTTILRLTIPGEDLSLKFTKELQMRDLLHYKRFDKSILV